MTTSSPIAFVGGGTMAAAIIGGLLRGGRAAASVAVVEPSEAQRARLEAEFGVRTYAAAGADALADATTVVWAIKPQAFHDAAAPCAPFVAEALQLSVMAGIRSASVARATGSERVVRSMPNTPALVGLGMTGLFARAAAGAHDRAAVETVLRPTGELLWVADEADLDAVTALSGSGPAYVFYFIEAMMTAAAQMGLDAAQGRRLALATFAGATALAQASNDDPGVLRERVTSKGGTTQAAIDSLEASGVGAAFALAMQAARRRAAELGDEFGA